MEAQSCQAQNPVLGNPSGCVPVGEVITYWALRFEAAVVFPKWSAASLASAAIWVWVALLGAAAEVSSHTPARAPPVGYPTCGTLLGQVLEPAATPSQYCVGTPLHVSLLAATPVKNACWNGAIALGSPV